MGNIFKIFFLVTEIFFYGDYTIFLVLQLTPTLNNVVNIKWAADYGKNWVVGIWLVEKLTSDQLLDRLVR